MKFEVGNIFEIKKTGINEKGEIQVEKTSTNQPLLLDVETIITGRTFIASKTRFGKSHTARKIIEKCYGHAGIIIIDPEGEYSSLREKYGFIIIGKDIPINIETAEFMAEQILKTKTSVIIDLSMVEDEEEGKEYVNLFLKKFFHLETTARQPYLVIVEESEDFIPEKGVSTETCLRTLFNYVKRGGKRGIGAIFVAHRPASVSKGILSQMDNKAIGNVESTDFEALKKVARVSDAIVELLPSLDKGEFFFTGTWAKTSQFIKVGPVETTHLGYTPKIVPLPPSDLQTVISKLAKEIPEFIEKVKPTVGSVQAAKDELRKELEGKYRDRIEAISKSADEKAERKYRVQIEELKENNDKLSRSSALQTAPITSVFEHPIVRTRMTELSDKAKDILIKIEQEPNLTRQQLAAFLTTSTDSVAYLIEKINEVFKAKVIVGEGKPMQYKSQLVYFFGGGNKKETQEIEMLQRKNESLNRIIEEKIKTISDQGAEIKTLRGTVVNVKELEKTVGQQSAKIQGLEVEKQKLIEDKKELLVMGKAGEALMTVIDMVVDRKLSNFKLQLPVAGAATAPAQPGIDMTEVEKIIDKKIKELAPTLPAIIGKPVDTISTDINLEHKVTYFDYQQTEEHVKADTTTLQGRIIYLITKDFFGQRHNPPEVTTELANNGWTHDKKDVSEMLLSLCQMGIFQRKFSTGNYWWYSLTTEAKERIHT